MKILSKIPFIELGINLGLAYCFLHISSWVAILLFWEFDSLSLLTPLEWLSLIFCAGFIYSLFIIIYFLLIDLCINELFLKFISKCKRNLFVLGIINIVLILINLVYFFGKFFLSFLAEYIYSLKSMKLFLVTFPIFIYFFTYAGFFTITILLWRFIDLFKDTTLAKKLRRIKRRVLGRVWPWLFKVYCKNKAIRRNFGEYL